MKVLITGGSGFIGTNLQRELTKQKISFEVFDKSEGQDVENERQLALFVKKKFDVIFHLAGTSGSAASNVDPLKSFKVNAFATTTLCELVVKFSSKTKLIISSSRLEYGNPQYLPVDENHPTVPTSAYGLSKLTASQMALIYHKNNNLDLIIFRTSNVYGPHKQGHFSGYNVVNHFIDQAKKDQDLIVYGDGGQKRDYLYIEDLADAFMDAATSKSPTNPVFNLGLGKPIKFIEMASLIVKKIGKGRIKFVKWPKDFESVETGDYVSDISKIKKELGFVPKYSFEEGIQKTLEIEN